MEICLELAPHQLEAIAQLKTGDILCGSVGSGKSRTALAYYYCNVCGGEVPVNGEGWYSPRTNPLKLYIITTARKRDTEEWDKELEPFRCQEPFEYVVDSWNNIEHYRDISDSFFIFDEQRVVGYGTWAKTFIRIAKRNDWILLTATPGDTWKDYIPVFIANGFYRNKSQFEAEHILYSRYTNYPKIEGYLNVQRLIHFRNSILVMMHDTRTTQMHDVTVHVDYYKEGYEYAQKNRWDIFKARPCRDVSNLISVLRKTVNTSTERKAAMYSLLISHPRLIVFYNFNYELDILRDICTKMERPFAEWNGHKHEPIPTEKSMWVYLVQYSAGAEGWNCIETDTIVFYSQSYSYKAMVQAAGRINRMNTPFKDLYTYTLISDAPIDKAIKACLDNKSDFNELIFAKQQAIEDS